MKKFTKLLGLLIVGTMGVSVAGCSMVQKTPEAIRKTVVAKVGDQKITLGEVDDKLQAVIAQIKESYGNDYEKNADAVKALKDQRKTAIDQMVEQKVLLKKSEELKVKPSDDELNKAVDTQIETYKTEFGGEDKLVAALPTYGLTMDSLKEMVKQNEIMNKVVDQVTKDISVSEDDVKEYYEKNKDTFTDHAGATVSHILAKFNDKNTTPTAEEDAKAKAKATEIKAELDKGGNFETLAKEKSEDTGSATSGGSLGHIDYTSTQFVKEFMDGFKDLNEGQVSGLVKSQYGYHIIKVKDVHKDDKVEPLETVKEDIAKQLLQEKQNKAYKDKMEEWKKDLKAEVYENKY